MTETPSTGVPWHLVLAVMAATVVAIAASVLAVLLLGAGRDPRQPPLPDNVGAIETTGFSSGAAGLDDELDAAVELQRWGWVDRRAGLITVPIDVAFDLYLQGREERR